MGKQQKHWKIGVHYYCFPPISTPISTAWISPPRPANLSLNHSLCYKTINVIVIYPPDSSLVEYLN